MHTERCFLQTLIVAGRYDTAGYEYRLQSLELTLLFEMWLFVLMLLIYLKQKTYLQKPALIISVSCKCSACSILSQFYSTTPVYLMILIGNFNFLCLLAFFFIA